MSTGLIKNYKFFFTPQMVLGLSGLCLITILALLAPVISPFDPLNINLAKAYQSPSFQHFFGLDENGLDLFSQVLYGSRISLLISVSVVSICLFLGLMAGSISAYAGGMVDQILMRLVDLVSAFPRFLLALAVLAFLGSSLPNLILALCLSGWTGFARLVRGEILHLKEEEYVLSARSYGTSAGRILCFHIWPNLLGILSVQVAFSLVAVVIAEAGLSFLGLGVPASIPSWGRLLSNGRTMLAEAPHISFFPGLALFLLVFSFQLCGESLRDFFDPKNRQGTNK